MKDNTLSWNDVTLGQYLDIQQILQEDLEDLPKLCRIVKVIYEEDLEDIPLNQMNEKLDAVINLLNDPPRRNKTKKIYTINGKDYKLTDFKNLSMAQFLDVNMLFKNPDLDLVMNKILSVFLIPIEATKYNQGYDLEEVQKELWNINVQDSNGISFFLVALLKKQYQRGLVYLIAQTLLMKGMTWKQKKVAIKSLKMGYLALDSLTL